MTIRKVLVLVLLVCTITPFGSGDALAVDTTASVSTTGIGGIPGTNAWDPLWEPSSVIFDPYIPEPIDLPDFDGLYGDADEGSAWGRLAAGVLNSAAGAVCAELGSVIMVLLLAGFSWLRWDGS